ncbi:hypothetical protein [Pseudaminobacter soli (ex Li et al. 2025)]|uniref:Uncharacterized protein n=1 Tax=Pseudaminobacter soli (ex Li et al. 2025) TaxID=1295366 RepID=A0A2P7SE87_9HYPH|nr:hypothetical protein [Mesorhizobium soli]PSJ60798.1 hypothetical protein C7I85_12205 [Mesorhizobium soli]
MNEIITQDGEVIEGMQVQAPSSSMAVQLQKAEIDQQITTAHAFPRSLKRVQSAIMSMATLDEESAEECMYALPRGGKPIKGPSVRFAEILKQAYGNCRAAARVVHVDRIEMFVEAEGVFHDLETNSATTTRVRRRISDRRGKVFNDDMIIVTGNAACAIAKRNAILDGIPKPLWRKAYETIQATITGDVTTLSENREKAFKALAAFGVKPEQVYQSLGIEGVEDISVDHIATLRGMYSALKNGEATVEEMFVGTVKPVSDHQKIADPLADEPVSAPIVDEPAASASEPTIEHKESSAPSTDVGSDSIPSPDGAAADLSAQTGDEEAGAEAADGQSAASASTYSRADCLKAFMTTATDKDLTVTERRDLLEQSKGWWKEALPNDLEFVRACLSNCDKVAKGELGADDARKYLEGLL